MPLKCKQEYRRVAASAALALSFLLSGATPGFPQDHAKPATDKWRPKDGPYASPGKDFDSQCGEYGDIVIEFARKLVNGNEWGCEINKLTDTGPDAIKLNMTCYDLNLAEALKRPDRAEDRTFKEVMLLKRINDKAMSVRKTLNGKFKDPSWQANYCPDVAQRMYTEAETSRRTAAEYKIPGQLLNPQQWRPRDGVYASTGADFNDRCTKSGDVIIGLTEGSVASGQGDCKVVGLMNVGVASVSMDMACSQTSGKTTTESKKKEGGATPEAEGPETIRMSKIDDNSFFLQKTQNRNFKDAGGPVAYCPEEVQRIYAAEKTKS